MLVLMLTGAAAFAQPNLPPTLPADQPQLETPQDTPLTITADMLNVEDEDPASVTVHVLPGFSYEIQGSDTVVPDSGFTGTLNVPAQVDDGEFRSNVAFITVVVTPVNRPPVLPTPPPRLSTPQDTPLTITAAMLNAEDEDPASLTVHLSAGDNYTLTGEATVVPNEGFSGTLSVEARVNDGEHDSDSVVVPIDVIAVNRPPTLPTPPPRLSTPQDTPLTITAGMLNAEDEDPAALTVRLSPGTNYTLPDAATLVPAAGFSGTLSVGARVNDGEHDSNAVVVTVDVTPANAPPTLPGSPPRLETPEDTPLTITPAMLGADDEDVGGLTVLLTPPGADANYTLSGTATVVPANDFNGTLTAEARVRDAEHTSNAVAVTIDVTPVNDAPRIDAIPAQSATESTPFTLDLGSYASDIEGDALQFAAEGLPPGLSIDGSTGAVSGTVPVGTEARDYEAELIVDDGSDTARAGFSISVLAADRADLEASIEAAPNPALTGEQATWTFGVRNAGSVDVANVTLTAHFTGDTPYRLDPVEEPSCSVEPRGNDTTVACSFSPLAGGESRTVDVTGQAAEVGEIETLISVEITDAVPIDDNDANDTARFVLEITERLSSEPSQELPAPGGTAAAAADIDGDGTDDIVVATAAGEPTLVFLNAPAPDDENKRAFAATPLSIGEPTAASSLAAGDLDDDGRVDIVVAITDGPNQVLFNAGSASFETVAVDGSDDATRAVAVADFDGDGLPDLAFAGDTADTVYLNLGGRRFAAAEAAGTGPSTVVAAADFGGDGIPDLIFAGADGNATILSRAAGGWAPAATLATGAAVTAVVIADFDANGAPDVAFGTEASDPVFLNTSGGGAPSFFLTDELGAAATAALLAGDFDADGRQDVVEIGAGGTHRLHKNSGTANTTFALHPEQFAGSAAAGAAIGRFDPDERPDVAVVGGDVVMVFVNDGRGNFGVGDTGTPRLALNGEPTVTVTVGDDYVDAGATASDDLDGDLTGEIVVDNPVDTDVIGTYTVTYSVVDSSGNRATLTRTVEVEARSGSGGGGGGAAGPLLLLLAALMFWIRSTRSCR